MIVARLFDLSLGVIGGLCSVNVARLFDLSLGVIGGLYSVIVTRLFVFLSVS